MWWIISWACCPEFHFVFYLAPESNRTLSEYKDGLSRYGDFHNKDRRLGDRLVFIMGITIQVKIHIYIDTVPEPRPIQLRGCFKIWLFVCRKILDKLETRFGVELLTTLWYLVGVLASFQSDWKFQSNWKIPNTKSACATLRDVVIRCLIAKRIEPLLMYWRRLIGQTSLISAT